MNKTAPFMLLFILCAAASWYFFTREPDAVHELPTAQLPVATPVEALQPGVLPDDINPFPEVSNTPDPLPLLTASDPDITQALAEILGVGPVAEYVLKSQVISRIVATVDSLTSRQVPAQINPVKPADAKFIVATAGENLVMSEQNFARYDAYITLIRDVNTGALVTLYQRYYPLFQQAWKENGGQGSFDQRLQEVITHLLDSPEVQGPVYMVKPEAVYLFEDTTLEAMTAGQKILVRMGSANASVAKETLLEFKQGISHP